MRDVQIDDEVWAALEKHILSFADTPNKVLRRLLDLDPQGKSSRNGKGSSRALHGELLPETEYWLPILKVLVALGGSARAKDVTREVGTQVQGRLTPKDLELLPSGTDVRWENRVAFARLRMVEKGLLQKSSRRGVWEVTSEGRLCATDPARLKQHFV